MKKRVLVWKKVQQMLAWGFLCMLMTACSVVRGYMTDGKDGPGIYSFKKHVHDTITKGEQSFHFPVAKQRASWIDTLHFYTQPPDCKDITFVEAMDMKSIQH